MKIISQNVVLSNKDSFILTTIDGKCLMNGQFVDLLCMTLRILAVMYKEGNSAIKKVLKEDFIDIYKKAMKNDFNFDDID